MSHTGDVKTTNGKTFAMSQSAELARLVYLRFGENLESATAAWNRLMQNNCDTRQFKELLDYQPPACVNVECGCGGTCPLNE